jgi:predicted  nucleic acid-binding Zn-ribbon protein
MNREITLMIELQQYWDTVLGIRSAIEKSERLIANCEEEHDKKLQAAITLENEILDEKRVIKEREIDLSEKDATVRKLEERKLMIRNEKELRALENEMDRINEERSGCEDELLALFDNVEEKEQQLQAMKRELEELGEKEKHTIGQLKKDIEENSIALDENRHKYDQILSQISPSSRSRFKKLAESGDGKAIVKLEDGICTGCHTTLPAREVLDASKDEMIISCTNCGRFVYSE